jgi:hypothetical protein
MIQYSIHYHKGSPSCSQVVYKEHIVADNDLEADKIRKVREKTCPVSSDFNLLSQTSYLAKHGLD